MSDLGEGEFLPGLMAYLERHAPAVRIEAMQLAPADVLPAMISRLSPELRSKIRLIALLGAMGCDVEVRVTPAPRRRAGRFTVKAA